MGPGTGLTLSQTEASEVGPGSQCLLNVLGYWEAKRKPQTLRAEPESR